jgi:hypothetical protein
MTAFTTQMTDQMMAFANQMTNLTNEIRAKSVFLSSMIQHLLIGLFRDTNALARLQNRMISNRNYPITSLANPRTGAAMPRFPATGAALSNLNGI